MDSIIVFLLVLTSILIVVKVIFLWWIFGPDIKLLRSEKKTPAAPECVYCRSKWTQPISGGELRWERDDLVLVTTYQCEHCELPFWHVERVPVVAQRR